MSVVRYFVLTVVKKDSVVTAVIEEKQRSQRSQRFHFNGSEVRQRSERSQRFHFNSSESKTM